MTMTTSLPVMLRRRSSDTLRPRLPGLMHAGNFGRCSGSSCFHWLLLAVCILVVSGGTSAMPARTVEGQERPEVDLGALLDAGDGAIVTLVAGTTRLAVHRAILVARSPVIALLFFHEELKSSSGEYVIRDVEGPELRMLVSFMYSGRAPPLPGMTPQLLEAAEKYAVSGLREAYERQLSQQLTVDNAAAIAVLAVTHGYSTLSQAAVAFIRDHGSQVMATPAFAEAVHSYPGAMVEFLRLLADRPADTRERGHPHHASATVCSEATPTTQPDSDDGRTSAAATPYSAGPQTPALDEAAVAQFRKLSSKQKDERLLLAAQDGAVGEVRALLAAEAQVDVRGWSGWTPLHRAARGGQVEAARYLLQAGAEVDARGSRWQETPLHHAAGEGRAAVARLLAAAGADLDARDSDRQTPLHWAAYWDRAEAALALMAAGADTGAKAANGKTPLGYARGQGHQQLVEILERK